MRSQPGHAQSRPAQTIIADPPNENTTTVSFGQSLESWLTQPTMTGDWDGLRTRLSKDGFDFRAGYIGEYAHNFSGGERIGTDYAMQFDLGMDVDMGKVAGLTGGSFHVTFNAKEGRSTSADFIGNKISVQEIYSDGENVRLAELAYEQSLLRNHLDLKAGFVILGNDFGKTPVLCSFENHAFCAHPQSLTNNSGWSDYPAGKWGVRVRANLTNDLYVEAGVYEVNPTYADHDNGFKLSLQGTTGALTPIEFSKTVELGPAAMQGHYKIGAYYDTSSAPDITNPSTTYSGRYGAYLLMDQMVWSFEPGTDRGLILVVDATVSDIRTATIPTLLCWRVDLAGAIRRPSARFHRGWICSGHCQQQPARPEEHAAHFAGNTEPGIGTRGEYHRGLIWVPGCSLAAAPSERAIYRQPWCLLVQAHPQCMGAGLSNKADILIRGGFGRDTGGCSEVLRGRSVPAPRAGRGSCRAICHGSERYGAMAFVSSTGSRITYPAPNTVWISACANPRSIFCLRRCMCMSMMLPRGSKS